MLYSANSHKIVTRMPHKQTFERWKSGLSREDYENIVDAINERIEGKEVNTAGWIPGSDWRGTPFQPIYEASDGNEERAGLFFGLLVFETLMNRPDKTWGFGRYELNGTSMRSMTYFEVNI